MGDIGMGKGSGVESYFYPLRFIITMAPTSLYFVYKRICYTWLWDFIAVSARFDCTGARAYTKLDQNASFMELSYQNLHYAIVYWMYMSVLMHLHVMFKYFHMNEKSLQGKGGLLTLLSKLKREIHFLILDPP